MKVAAWRVAYTSSVLFNFNHNRWLQYQPPDHPSKWFSRWQDSTWEVSKYLGNTHEKSKLSLFRYHYQHRYFDVEIYLNIPTILGQNLVDPLGFGLDVWKYS